MTKPCCRSCLWNWYTRLWKQTWVRDTSTCCRLGPLRWNTWGKSTCPGARNHDEGRWRLIVEDRPSDGWDQSLVSCSCSIAHSHPMLWRKTLLIKTLPFLCHCIASLCCLDEETRQLPQCPTNNNRWLLHYGLNLPRLHDHWWAPFRCSLFPL